MLYDILFFLLFLCFDGQLLVTVVTPVLVQDTLYHHHTCLVVSPSFLRVFFSRKTTLLACLIVGRALWVPTLMSTTVLFLKNYNCMEVFFLEKNYSMACLIVRWNEWMNVKEWINRTEVNRYEWMWTEVNICEQMWTDVNRCESMWIDVNMREWMWTDLNISEGLLIAVP